MEIKLCNDNLEIIVSSYGGELIKLFNKKNSTDYLFDRDKNYWNFQSPLLFPIVGGLLNDKFIHNGKEYSLPKHGFCRTSEFSLEQLSNYEVCASLKFDSNTLKQYPFKFSLDINYILDGNSVKVNYSVKNLDSQDIFFCIGGHPAFKCPINKEGKFSDYYLEFEESEVGYSTVIGDDGFFREDEKLIINNTNKIKLDYDLFLPDAIVFEELSSSKVSIKSDKYNESLDFDYGDFPIIAFWTKGKDKAPFICIEPWFGHGDFADYKGEFQDRDGVVALEVNNVFEASYTISLN